MDVRIIDMDRGRRLVAASRDRGFVWEPVGAGYPSADGRRWEWPDGTSVPLVRGASSGGPDTNPVQYPLALPTITGETVTLDVLLNQPTRITHFLMDITQERFIIDRVFSSPGGVTGGAVIFDQIIANDLYVNGDVQPVAPAAEFPIVTSGRRAPKVAGVEKYGGKFWFSDEARDRNDAVAFRNEATRLGNTIVRKLNTRAVTVLNAAISALAGATSFTGNNWETAVPRGSTPTAPPLTPGADFAKAQLLEEQAELGYTLDVALVNPIQLNSLRLYYEELNGLEQMLQDNGFNEVYASNRVPVGSAYFVARGMAGQLRVEQPLATETWRQPENQRTWVQSSVRPVMFVDQPYAVIQATGL